MATQTVTTQQTYTSSSSQTEFTNGIQILKQDDLDVWITDSDTEYGEGVKVLQVRGAAAGSAIGSSHPQVTGAVLPALASTVKQRGYTLADSDTKVILNASPTTGSTVVLDRHTDDSSYTTFASGSTIRSSELNTAFDQARFTAQEARNLADDIEGKKLDLAGGVLTGHLRIGEDQTVIFEGATDDAYETTLTVTDPTADRTITLPNVTGTVVTTGDTGTVTATMLASGAVATADIAADAITGAKIADDSIDSEHYTDASIDTAHIADSQVTTAKIAADAITGAKIADDAIDSEHYVDGSIDAAHIASNAVTTAKINADAVTGAKIADDSIDSEHYTDGSIDTAHIADLQVTTAKIAADAITGAKIADDAIDSEHYTDGSIDTAHIANSQVTTAKIAADNITNALIADDQIDSEHYVDGSIDTAHLADDAVTTAKIADDAITSALIADDAVVQAAVADEAVDEVRLQISNAGSNGQFLQKQSGNTGGLTWASPGGGTATAITIADESSDTTCFPLFATDATGDIGPKSDSQLTYNSSTGALGATTFVGNVDAVDGDFDGTLEADAITIDGTALNEYIADTVGGMVTGNTETGITVTYEDGDNTLDFVLAADSVSGSNIADDAIDSEHYVDGSIDTAHLAADVVTGAKIADDAIDSEHYTDGSIDTAHLAADVITGAKIADDAIDSEHYTDGSIDTAHLAADVVTGAKIADDAIDSEHYTDGSIDTAHIADDQVTLAKMAGLARGKIIYGDSSGNPAALAVGAANKVLKSDGTDISWGDAAAGATGGSTDKIFWENAQTVTTNYTITNNMNAGSFGPITINSGVTVTVGAGEVWSII